MASGLCGRRGIAAGTPYVPRDVQSPLDPSAPWVLYVATGTRGVEPKAQTGFRNGCPINCGRYRFLLRIKELDAFIS